MNGFYAELKKAVKTSECTLYAETCLEGERAGQKRLLFSLEDRETDARVFCERIGRTPKLTICGAGHVSMPVIRMGRMLGFRVTVIDDRPKFADDARRSGADRVLCEPFADALSRIEGDRDSWFVIVTRGHRFDTLCLDAILKKPSAYVGMMGSRRRVALVKEQLAGQGVSRGKLEQVHTPIGLSIGAQTPEEIAVSILAEIIQVKNSRNGQEGDAGADVCTGMYPEEILACIFGQGTGGTEKAGQKKVLATIISRKGSAPRGAGTKMLVFEDGSTVDTIGGGCIESDIIQKALLMMRTGDPDFQICTVNLTVDAAEEEGMVCGGVVEVMLERI